MFRSLRTLLMVVSALAMAVPSAVAAPLVITSILPLHSIASNVMGDLGTPTLLFSGRNSEHGATLSPQQISSLGQAGLVFFIGAGLETKLQQLSGTDGENSQAFHPLANAPGVKLLPLRQGGAFEPDTAEAEEAGTSADDPLHPRFNPHIWLDPENGKAIAAAMAEALAQADPPHAATYRSNAGHYQNRLTALEATLAAQTRPVQHQPFIVFHDAYAYFEARFGLNGVGSIADASAAAPSARRLGEVKAKLADSKAVCVFREPQFDDKYVRTVLEDSSARSAVLDATGFDLSPGPQAYEQLLINLASALTDCLKP
jgi:zinc transport system substrate-binding protein